MNRKDKSAGSVIRLMNRNFIYCDIGARWGLKNKWKLLRKNIDIIGFEPDQDECDELIKIKNGTDLFLP